MLSELVKTGWKRLTLYPVTLPIDAQIKWILTGKIPALSMWLDTLNYKNIFFMPKTTS